MWSCSGIGRALCERLLAEDSGLRLCLACRNMQRAEAARSALLSSHSLANVDLLQLDVGSAQSVLGAAQEIKARYVNIDLSSSKLDAGLGLREPTLLFLFFCRYNRVDFMYLNAGIMPNPQVNVRAFFKGLFSR